MAGLMFLVAVGLVAIFAPIVSFADPNAGELRMVRKPPQAGHVLGTDGAGRDVWARLVFASRVSLTVGVASMALATLIGVLLGGVAGFAGGKIDSLIMRFTDIILCFPTLLVILSVVSVVGPSAHERDSGDRRVHLAGIAGGARAVSLAAAPGVS